MHRHISFCAAVGTALLSFFFATTAVAEPTLTGAWLETQTHREDRDHDTCINVEARSHYTHKLIAARYLYACNGQYGSANDTYGVDDIKIVNGPWAKSEVQNFDFRMGMTPNGSDTWKFSAWVHLCFSDHSELHSDKLDQTIDANTGGKFPAPVWNHKEKPVLFQLNWANNNATPPQNLAASGAKADATSPKFRAYGLQHQNG